MDNPHIGQPGESVAWSDGVAVPELTPEIIADLPSVEEIAGALHRKWCVANSAGDLEQKHAVHDQASWWWALFTGQLATASEISPPDAALAKRTADQLATLAWIVRVSNGEPGSVRTTKQWLEEL